MFRNKISVKSLLCRSLFWLHRFVSVSLFLGKEIHPPPPPPHPTPALPLDRGAATNRSRDRCLISIAQHKHGQSSRKMATGMGGALVGPSVVRGPVFGNHRPWEAAWFLGENAPTEEGTGRRRRGGRRGGREGDARRGRDSSSAESSTRRARPPHALTRRAMDGYARTEDELFSACLLNLTWESCYEQTSGSLLSLKPAALELRNFCFCLTSQIVWDRMEKLCLECVLQVIRWANVLLAMHISSFALPGSYGGGSPVPVRPSPLFKRNVFGLSGQKVCQRLASPPF
ncbi:unnamed protein product [Pleuronectes platessa]|uniref:Uncharacterized protein n=1 Tax=Pleuronectes platessa TaxID=8262 RepID=A0A9N7VXB3_PLEPL|nr:unnamed protein product [Pleuronectes platessa]